MRFEPVSLSHQERMNSLLKSTPQVASDFSFANIYGWAKEYRLEICFEQNLAWIRQNHPEVVYWAPVGNWAINWVPVLKKIPKNSKIERVPEKLALIWMDQLPETVITPDRDHWDYLYSVSDLIELKGNRFHNKKNLFNQFVKNYSYTYVELEKKYIEKALALQTEWCLWKECDDSSALDAENQAIVRIFSQWDKISGIFGAGLMTNNRMIAYTVAESLPDNTLVIHFEKGCPGYKGVYQAINRLFLEKSAGSFKIVNREQDLGDPGLRKAKESYNPSRYLKKYKALL